MFFDWDLLVFIFALTVAASVPGPGLAAIVATVLTEGTRVAMWFCIGVIAGDLMWLALSLSGLSLIAQQFPVVFVGIKWAGVTYLIYLAVKTWRSSTDPQADVTKSERKTAAFRVLSGFSVTMGNPKMMLFYIALLPTIVSAERLSVSMALSLVSAVILVLGLVFTLYVLAAERARRFITSKQSVRTFNRVTASALGGAAVWIAVK